MATTTRQRLAGGFVIGVAALAFYFGTQFKGPGLGGSGIGDGGTETGEGIATTAVSNSSASDSDLAGDEAVQVSVVPTTAQQFSQVTVVISGSEYMLSTTGDVANATPASLADVARAALAATGDGQGIRVRIFRKKDATAGAKIDLFSKLGDAGIASESIQDMREFLE